MLYKDSNKTGSNPNSTAMNILYIHMYVYIHHSIVQNRGNGLRVFEKPRDRIPEVVGLF